jgi:hypothetical protein
MAKKTPAQSFRDIFNRFVAGSTEDERKTGERMMNAWLKRHGKTSLDIQFLLAQAVRDDASAAPPPPPTDSRDGAPHPFDGPAFTPIDLVYGIAEKYLVMEPHALTIYATWICFTHIYPAFEIAPRILLTSRRSKAGKSTARKVATHLVLRPNRAVFSTLPVLRDFLGGGPGTLQLDELDYADTNMRRQLRQIWNLGYEYGAMYSLKEGKEDKLVNIYAPILGAGIGKDFLEDTQATRTYQLDMERHPNEAERCYNSRSVDDLNAIYSYLRGWARTAKLNAKPDTTGLIGRAGDNARGMLAVADYCGPEWGGRVREALRIYEAREEARQPHRLIIEHGLAIFDAQGLAQRSDIFSTTEFNRELRQLDLAGAPWSRYRGAGGRQYEHPISVQEQADLLREEPNSFESHTHWPPGPRSPGASFKAYRRGDFEDALRRHMAEEAKSHEPRLRLVGSDN